MPSAPFTKRSRRRRLGESAYGFLLLARTLLLVLVTVTLLGVGAWMSWGNAYPALVGSDTGTVRVTSCGEDECTGRFTPDSGAAPTKVTVAHAVSGTPGEQLDVVVSDSTGNHVVPTDTAGILYSWAPFAGALLLASIVVVGGLKRRRLGISMGLVGAAVLGTAWGLLTF